MILILVCFVGYRQDGSTECTRIITDLASACQTLAVLNAKSYFEGFKVAKVIRICSNFCLHFYNNNIFIQLILMLTFDFKFYIRFRLIFCFYDIKSPFTSRYPLFKCLVILVPMAVLRTQIKYKHLLFFYNVWVKQCWRYSTQT